MSLILAADIGGTNCRFAIYRFADSPEPGQVLRLEREQWLPAAGFASFDHLFAALCSGEKRLNLKPFLLPGEKIAAAVFAPAGPIQHGVCHVSNLPWTIDSREIRRILAIDRVFMINDFIAQAQACLLPELCDAVRIEIAGAEPAPGEAEACASETLAVIGAGTGLGHALILDADPLLLSGIAERTDLLLKRLGRARVLPSEAGHADFAFSGRNECDFSEFVRHETGLSRLIGDNIVTGSGLAHIHAFLSGKRVSPEEATLLALEHPETLEWFARFYGRACRNYVLSTLALGGLFITGGMALRLPVLEHPAFAAEFLASRAHSRLLARVPVLHMRKPQAGLLGAALYGLLQITGQGEPV